MAQNPAAGEGARQRRSVADWRELAACRHIDPDLFFPVGTTGLAPRQIEVAKRVCRSCDVVEPCLEFALVTNQESGVWGGTSEEERRRLRKSWLAVRRRTRPQTGEVSGQAEPSDPYGTERGSMGAGKEAS